MARQCFRGSLRFVFRALSVVGVMVPSAQARHPRELIAGSSRRRVWWTTCFIFVVIALGSMSVASTYRVFAHTFDEPAHIAAGMELLDHGSFSYEQLHPPLARLAVALGPYLKGARSQGRAEIFSEGLAILYQGGEYQATLVAARLGVLPFLMILIAAASIWAYHDFGAVAAVTTAAAARPCRSRDDRRSRCSNDRAEPLRVPLMARAHSSLAWPCCGGIRCLSDNKQAIGISFSAGRLRRRAFATRFIGSGKLGASLPDSRRSARVCCRSARFCTDRMARLRLSGRSITTLSPAVVCCQ